MAAELERSTSSGIDPESGEWRPRFPSQREPARTGNTLALKTGAYAVVHQSEEACQIADDLRPLVPGYSLADEPLLQLCGKTIAQTNAGSRALARIDEMAADDLAPYMTEQADKIQRLREDVRRWIALSAKLMAELGLTPKSRIAMSADVVRVEEGITALREEGRKIRLAREATG